MPPSLVPGSTLSAAARALAQFVRTVIEGPAKYHPEQHYMRGPGPKWHAKHDRAAVSYRAVPVLVPVRVKR